MKILVYRWDIFPYDAILETFQKQGYCIDTLVFPISNHLEDPAFEQKLSTLLVQGFYDLVFSVNYFSCIAAVCAKHNIPYAAWTCDAPLIGLQNESVLLPTTHIFCFDKKQYEEVSDFGAPHCYYLPLAGCLKDLFPAKKPSYDISFVGNLYDKNRYNAVCSYLPAYLQGYLDAAIEAQKRVSGGNLLLPMLNDEILSDFMNYVTVEDGTHSIPELRLQLATRVLSHKVAADVRTSSLNALAKNFKVDLFTTSKTDRLKRVTCHPAVSYQDEMPQVFAGSKINLNFTAPNIENGVPLRVFDVLAAGGFLLTDYRQEVCSLFENGTDLVVYDGLPDLLQKAGYYLNHPQERLRIAKNGQNKIKQRHQYSHRLAKLIASVFANS